MFALINTFARHSFIVSRHRTLTAAVRAQNQYNRMVRKAPGQNAYLPTAIREIRGGALLPVDENAVLAAEMEALRI